MLSRILKHLRCLAREEKKQHGYSREWYAIGCAVTELEDLLRKSAPYYETEPFDASGYTGDAMLGE